MAAEPRTAWLAQSGRRSHGRILGKIFGQRPPSGRSQQQQRSLGSGFIIGSDGSIVTNAHVIDNAKKIIVKLSDKREFEAKVLGKDPKTDVAVIKIDSDESLPTADLGILNSSEVGNGLWL
mgnify:CR=1 FL=1